MAEHEKILFETKQYVCRTMSNNDAAHDEEHVRRVVAIAKQLCKACPEADPFRVELLAWLHDMNDDKLRSDVGTESLAAFLRSIGTEEDDVRFVTEGIPYLSYRKYPKLDPQVSLEIRIVQDADRIDAMGAIGVARAFAYGGSKNRPMGESLAHFDEKLLLLYDLLNTDAAKSIAKPRHEFLKQFYEQYQSECILLD